MGSEPGDDELAARAGGGDSDAFRQLLERHYDLIFRTAYRFCLDRSDAEDVAQDVCLGLVRSVASYRAEASFTSWLYRIVVNKTRDQQRKTDLRQRLNKRFGEVESMRKAEEMQHMQDMKWLRDSLERLGDDLRSTAVLVVGEGLSHRETGEILGVKESTISWRMHEVRKALREIAREEA